MANLGSARAAKDRARISGNVVIAHISGGVIISSTEINVDISGDVVRVTTLSGEDLDFSVSGQPVEPIISSIVLEGSVNFNLSSVTVEGTVNINASGTIVRAVNLSGDDLTVSANVSGQIIRAVNLSGEDLTVQASVSGQPVDVSGSPVLVSGETITVASGAYLASGIWFASGHNVITSVSGQILKVLYAKKTVASSDSTLDSGQSYESGSEDTTDYIRFAGSVYSENSPGTLIIEQSMDSSNWDVGNSIEVGDGSGKSFSIYVVNQYIRVRYLNGAGTQSSFRINASLCVV